MVKLWLVVSQLTFFLDRIAHSSNVSAASYFPCRLYNAPKFFKVVVTVGLKIYSNCFKYYQGKHHKTVMQMTDFLIKFI